MEKINVLFESSPDYSNNAKALFEYMNDHYKDKINLYWVFNDNEIYLKYKDKLNCVLYNSKDFKKLFPKINIIFTTHGQLIEEKLSNQIYVNLWHGIGMKKLGHFLSRNNFAPQDQKFYDDLQSKMDYIIVPSKFWQMLFSVMFNFDYNRILPIGYPKLDPIVKANGKENLKKVLNTNISKYKKIIYYMPTFRNGLGRNDAKLNINNIFNFQEYDEQKLFDFLSKNNYLLCLKHHPAEEKSFNYKLSDNIKIIKENELQKYSLSVNDVLNAADLLITDYSSLGVEFSILNKPSIYLVNDLDEYSRNRGIIFDNMNFWAQGNLAKNIDELFKIIDNNKVLKNDMSVKKIWFDELKDGGCDNICDYFFEKSGKLKENLNYDDSLILKQEKQIENLNDEISKIVKEKEYFKRLNEQHEQELKLIRNSKSWIALEKMRKFKRNILNIKH